MGRSIPNFAFDDGEKMNELLRAAYGILLDFDGSASLEALANEYGGRIKYHARRTAERFSLSAALIRPDGIVAWASDDLHDVTSIRAAAALWFGPKDQP